MTTTTSHIIQNVPYIDQTANWPTGCESVSSVMLLQYLGLDISMETFVTYLPKYPMIQEKGCFISADPNEYFIGSPDDPHSFGCYAPVIVDTVNRIFKEWNQPYLAVNLSSKTTEELLETYISQDMPVIYWTTIDLKESYIGPTWQIKEKGAVGK